MKMKKEKDSYRTDLYRKEYERNPDFERNEKFFLRIRLWWIVFSVAAAAIMELSLYLSRNIDLTFMLFPAMIPVTVAACCGFVKSGMRGVMYVSLMGALATLFIGIMLLRTPDFSSGIIWTKLFVIVLILASAVQLALSVYVYVSRKIASYVNQRVKLENRLRGNF